MNLNETRAIIVLSDDEDVKNNDRIEEQIFLINEVRISILY